MGNLKYHSTRWHWNEGVIPSFYLRFLLWWTASTSCLFFYFMLKKALAVSQTSAVSVLLHFQPCTTLAALISLNKIRQLCLLSRKGFCGCNLLPKYLAWAVKWIMPRLPWSSTLGNFSLSFSTTHRDVLTCYSSSTATRSASPTPLICFPLRIVRIDPQFMSVTIFLNKLWRSLIVHTNVHQPSVKVTRMDFCRSQGEGK